MLKGFPDCGAALHTVSRIGHSGRAWWDSPQCVARDCDASRRWTFTPSCSACWFAGPGAASSPSHRILHLDPRLSHFGPRHLSRCGLPAVAAARERGAQTYGISLAVIHGCEAPGPHLCPTQQWRQLPPPLGGPSSAERSQHGHDASAPRRRRCRWRREHRQADHRCLLLLPRETSTLWFRSADAEGGAWAGRSLPVAFRGSGVRLGVG